MANYRDRVTQQIDRWIAAGLVSADKREPMLASLPETRRIDAATALAWVGGVLLGMATITFVAANWDALPRLARFGMVLAAFLAASGAGAWAAQRGRPMLSDIALTLAAAIFAAAIGLTGQIFDITGDPRAAAHGAGFVAFALALAGRSTGAACAGLILIGVGDFTGRMWFSGLDGEAPLLLIAGPLGAFLALRWASFPLTHAAALGLIACFSWFATQFDRSEAGIFLFLAICMGAMAAGARWLGAQGRTHANVFYGWFAWGGLVFFAIAGYLPWFGAESGNGGLTHRAAWLLLSGALIALGRFDRHALVTTIGVLSMIGAIFALLGDLGLDLLAAAGVFGLCALAALIAGLALRRKKTHA